MKYPLVILLIMANICVAQDKKVYDFSSVDPKSVNNNRIIAQLDSIIQNSAYDSLLQLNDYVLSRIFTPRYLAWVFGYQSSFASLQNLNSELPSLGFNQVSTTFGGAQFGFDIRGKRLLFSTVFTGSMKNTVSNKDYTLEVNGFSLELSIGYDILNLKRLHFYPFTSLAIQEINMTSFRNESSVDVINVTEFILNPAGSTLYKNRVAFVYGGEFDFHLIFKQSGEGLILGVRYGRSQLFGDDSFKINKNNSAYNSSDVMYNSYAALVLKLYIKR